MSVQVETAFIALLAAMLATIVAAWLTRLLKISEFRQIWINALRDDIAAYLGATQKWFNAYGQGEEDSKLFTMGNEAAVILYRIKMRFNPNNNKFKKQDDEFLAALDEIRMPYRISKLEAEGHWFRASEEITARARVVLKREWEITKRFFVWPWTPQG